MQITADLHLHSKFSRAVSQQMVLPIMAQVAAEKGLQLLSLSDWTHPAWRKEVADLINESAEGIYQLKEGGETVRGVRFLFSTEISSIYKEAGKLRRIHNLLFVSSLQKADEFSNELVKRGCNISSDGRPIVGLSSRDLLELLLETDEKGFLIPCHVWTPHFGLYGSASGYDSIQEAFGDLSDYIYGVETGLSSDPEMNWQIGELANRSILSFSDAHSPAKMGREATVMSLAEVTFANVKEAIMRNDERNRIDYTLEFYPEEGKYHFSGHRACKVRLTPDELSERGEVCPVCRKQLTEGVFVRLAALAGKSHLEHAVIRHDDSATSWYEDPAHLHPPFVKLVPLLEIIAESLGSTVASQKVKLTYTKAIQQLGSELAILLTTPLPQIEHTLGETIAQGIAKVRQGDIAIEPGYDGEYGKVRIWGSAEDRVISQQKRRPQLQFDL